MVTGIQSLSAALLGPAGSVSMLVHVTKPGFKVVVDIAIVGASVGSVLEAEVGVVTVVDLDVVV